MAGEKSHLARSGPGNSALATPGSKSLPCAYRGGARWRGFHLGSLTRRLGSGVFPTRGEPNGCQDPANCLRFGNPFWIILRIGFFASPLQAEPKTRLIENASCWRPDSGNSFCPSHFRSSLATYQALGPSRDKFQQRGQSHQTGGMAAAATPEVKTTAIGETPNSGHQRHHHHALDRRRLMQTCQPFRFVLHCPGLR
jgi:hypothetical protein